MASTEQPLASPVTVPFPGTLKSPSKDQHPYAIKSTSTALLTRSNSTSGNSQRPQFYSPTSSATNAPQLGRSQSRGHRHSRSLSNATPPQPLPLPPGSDKNRSQVDDYLTSGLTNGASIADLPDNPKLWTPSQLALYLSSALRLKGQGALPAPVANDIGAFVLREKLGGRAFLRMGEENLAAMEINHLWRASLLAASRTLKKKVLQGRIWGFGSPIPGSVETPISPTTVDPTKDDETAKEMLENPFRTTRKYRSGRVRNIIQNLERSSGSTSSGGSDDGEILPSELSDELIKKELEAAGLLIEEEQDDDTELNYEPSSSSASDGESIYGRDTRNSSLSGPPSLVHSRSQNTSDEPSIEELLAQEGEDPIPHKKQTSSLIHEAPSRGALAWENGADLLGGTAKRLVEPTTNAIPTPKSKVVDGRGPVKIGDMFDTTDATSTPSTEQMDLLQAFKDRLERMEKRLAELEERDVEREKELSFLRSQQHTSQEQLAKALAAVPKLEHSAVAPTTSDKPSDSQNKHQDTPDNSTPRKGDVVRRRFQNNIYEEESSPKDPNEPGATELPSYVLLVSLGVVAVVFRVLFRNIRGRRQ